MSQTEEKKGERSSAPANKSRYPLASIPSLTVRREIDVDALNGNDLTTYVNYPGITDGDRITVVWRGADGAGKPFDDTGAVTPVLDPDPDLGARVSIRNNTLLNAKGGSAFYSYQINGEEETESLRLFCFVGLNDELIYQEHLGVVQVLESHDRIIEYNALGSVGATVFIPYYQAMQVGDVVTLVLDGVDEDGKPITQKTYDCSPQAEHLGRALECPIRRTDLRDLVNGQAWLNYLIELKGAPSELSAPIQVFDVKQAPADEPRLPAMNIVDFSGDVLDPDAFVSGLVIQAQCPAQAKAGDLVLCHWNGGRADNRHILALRLDASSLPDGVLQFKLDPKALGASVNDEVDLFFQIAREGWARSSLPLSFKVERTRGVRVPPTVENTTAEAGGAFGSASEFKSGAWVNVPAGVVQEKDHVKVHWECDAYAGRVTIEAAEDPDNPLRFKIPAAYIAANMEQSNEATAKRFSVSYTLGTDNGDLPSETLGLRIQPMSRGEYLQVVCNEADAQGALYVGNLTDDSQLVLKKWPFMAIGNRVTIQVTGVQVGGGEYQKTLRDAQLVNSEELSQGLLVSTVPLQDLKHLENNSRMSMKAEISFDNGQSYHSVPDSSVSIRL